jgi:hypothetical protein
VRAMRKFFNLGLLVLGIVVILTASLLVEEVRIRSLIILAGILLIQASVWGLAHRVLLNRRQFNALRREIDEFTALCYQLNSVALAIKAENLQEYHDDFNGIQARMLEKVGHITGVVGQTDEELARELSLRTGDANTLRTAVNVIS